MTVQTGWQQAFALAQSGEQEAALALCWPLIDGNDGPEAFEIAGSILIARGEADAAATLYRQGIARFPHDPVLAINGARLLRQYEAHIDEALAILDACMVHNPDHAQASHVRIETLRTAAQRPVDAEREAHAHIARFPDHGGGHLALALSLLDQGKLRAGLPACEAAARFPLVAARAWETHANICVALGDAAQAVSSYRAALALAPDPELHSRLLMSMMYCDDIPVADIHAETRAWARIHCAGIPAETAWAPREDRAGRRLRVGFLSGDFRLCSTPFLAFPLWENAPKSWDIHLYDTAPRDDLWGERFRQASAAWRDVSLLDDEQIAARVRSDGIDVLVDLNGHTLNGRPGVFHRKPAPVQIAWLDYVSTTGLASFDAIIADARHIPLAEQPLYGEPIRHVRDNLYRYRPPDDVPAVSPLPAERTGAISFGCFNAVYKLSPTTLDLWAAILAQVPESRLILNSREYAAADTCDRIREAFAARGIAAERIRTIAGAASPADLMAQYRDIDIALDPFPYSGGLTTLEALYMGVPVVTMRGDRFGSRHSAAHLDTIGLPDWIAADGEGYVTLAIEKSRDIIALRELRQTLRQRVEASPLRDGAALAQDLEAIVADLAERAGLFPAAISE